MSNQYVQRRQRLQALYDQVNQGGSWMTIAEGDEEPLYTGMMGSFTVTRVARDGSFWLFCFTSRLGMIRGSR